MNWKALVVGYGNTLRSDDGFGVHAAELLGQLDLPHTEVLVLQQLTPELAEDLAGVDLVVFLDADAGAAPGEIVRTPLAAGHLPAGGLSHHISPAALLGMSAALYGRAPQGWLFSVGAQDFGMGETLSPAVEAAVPVVLGEVESLIRNGYNEANRRSEDHGET